MFMNGIFCSRNGDIASPGLHRQNPRPTCLRLPPVFSVFFAEVEQHNIFFGTIRGIANAAVDALSRLCPLNVSTNSLLLNYNPEPATFGERSCITTTPTFSLWIVAKNVPRLRNTTLSLQAHRGGKLSRVE